MSGFFNANRDNYQLSEINANLKRLGKTPRETKVKLSRRMRKKIDKAWAEVELLKEKNRAEAEERKLHQQEQDWQAICSVERLSFIEYVLKLNERKLGQELKQLMIREKQASINALWPIEDKEMIPDNFVEEVINAIDNKNTSFKEKYGKKG